MATTCITISVACCFALAPFPYGEGTVFGQFVPHFFGKLPQTVTALRGPLGRPAGEPMPMPSPIRSDALALTAGGRRGIVNVKDR